MALFDFDFGGAWQQLQDDPQKMRMLQTGLGMLGGQSLPLSFLNATLTQPTDPAAAQPAQDGAPMEDEAGTNGARRSLDLADLQTAVQTAYPGNPAMQQVALTQAILESGLGRDGGGSTLATRHNNLFGIKGRGTAGRVTLPTTEYLDGQKSRVRDAFARNASLADSFAQHRDLMNRQRYASVLDAPNVNAAFSALQRAGYATDPRYAMKLQQIHQRHVQPLYQ